MRVIWNQNFYRFQAISGPLEERIVAVSFLTEKNDKSALIAQKVMHAIGENNLKPLPEVFSVLYAHYSGMNPDITKAIDSLPSENKTLTTSVCEELHDLFLSPRREKQLIDETAQKVHDAMEEISQLIHGAGMAHKEYNQTLQRQSDNLSSETDITKIKKMINVLVDDTRRMIEENHKLEDKLNTSSNELTQMRQDMIGLKAEAMTDALTGMPNRKAFDLELKTRASEALERGRAMSLVLVDIDHFKIFNDTFGHQVGDQVLKLVAKTMSEGLRPGDFLARYGGEEFAIVVPGAKLRDAEKLADRLRERIADKDIVNQSKNEKLGRLSISLGVSQLQPGEALDHLIDRSDRALYKAKAAGRNTVVAIEYDKNLHENRSNIQIS